MPEGKSKIEAQYTVFKENDLLSMINNEIKKEIPAGYIIQTENSIYIVSNKIPNKKIG